MVVCLQPKAARSSSSTLALPVLHYTFESSRPPSIVQSICVAHSCVGCCRQVSLEEGDAKARELQVNFIETSAKAGFNIKVCCTSEEMVTCAKSVAAHNLVEQQQ